MTLVTKTRTRAFGSVLALTLLVAACGNAGSSKSSDTTAPAGPSTTFKGTDYSTNQPVKAPGVSSTEIRVGSVVSITNPVGGDYGLLNDGIDAYFNVVNAQGGVWGRKLKLVSKRDDQLSQNTTQVEALLSQDNVYAAFIASQLFTGAPELAKAGIPTYGWNINAEWAGPKNFFPNVAPICFKGCTSLGRLLPYVIKQVGAHKVALIGYNVAQSSDSINGSVAEINKFSSDIGATVAFSDTSLSFGQTDYSAQVSQMKAKGVDFVATALDTNGDYALAKEMKKQGILDKVTFFHPNLYDPDFIKQNAATLEGGIVFVGILATQHSPAPPALQQYIDYTQQHGLKLTEMTEQGWIAARQFVDSLKAAGPDFTWANLENAWNQQTSYSNGGMVTPIDWTFQHADPSTSVANRSQFECGNFVKIHNGTFEGIYDDGGAKPWVCFNGKQPDEWETPANVSFDGPPFKITDVVKPS